MRKVKQSTYSVVGMAMLAMVVLIISSCTKDPDTPTFGNPSIAFADGDVLEVKRGETISVDFNLNAEGGNKELLVFRGGGLLERVALSANATTYTYSNQSVPESAEEGEEFAFDFSLVNTQNVESDRISLTVSTLAYGTISIGGETLYEVDIPEDEIIEGGVSYKFVTGRKYYLNKAMRFQAGSSLTIEEGVELYANTSANPVVDIDLESGSTVSITGTADAPIVITSDKSLTGDAAPGDWGWVNLRVDDGSGTIEYLRLEYGGNRSFRTRGVTAGTKIQNIQVYKADGEGFMVTGGDANFKYLVATDCLGGGFRFGDDYSGNVQFAIVTTTIDDDNDEFSVRETASPHIANVTVLGPGTDVDNTHGMRLRAASSAKVYNTIIAEFPRRGLRLNDEVQVTDLNGSTVFAYSYIFNVPRDPFRDDTDNGNPFQGYIDGDGQLQNPFHNNVTGFDGDDPELAEIAGIAVGDFIPDAETTSAFNPSSLGSFFSDAPFVGAVRNAANDWTVGWVKNSDGTVR